MPARRLLMRKIREILRLRHEQGLSHREIAQACFIGAGTVSRYLHKMAERGLGWPLPTELDNAVLEAQLFRRPAAAHDRVRPDCAYIHRELKRDGVTLQLLWEEYAQVHPQGYRRTQFCAIYQQWARRLRPSMRQVHRAGEKAFLDFSGKRHGTPSWSPRPRGDPKLLSQRLDHGLVYRKLRRRRRRPHQPGPARRPQPRSSCGKERLTPPSAPDPAPPLLSGAGDETDARDRTRGQRDD